jgi:serine/threonine protein kinase
MDDLVPHSFGRYEILAELGRGAMGVVYKARDPKINRIVAVKTISLAGQTPDDEREYRERFYREAEAAGRLSHPGIVTIFDVGEEPETRAPFIVMEYVGGESLENLLSQGERKLPVEKALQLALELAEALDCAHGQGVVHRDLKPANILLTEDGHAKIADFGVAKLNLANHTLAGCALGTPAYMSPEQLNGEAVDGRSDVFSLGVVLYTVLTGYRPFQGNSALTVSFKVVNRDPIPATLLDTELPEGLDAIIARAMAKNPADRYQRGMEMIQDIRRLQVRQKRRGMSTQPVLAALTTGQTATENVKPSLGQPEVATQLLENARFLPLMDAIGRKSLIGVFVLTGLFILGLWVISFGPQGLRSRAAEPLATPVEADAVKTATTFTTPAGQSTTISTPTVSPAPPVTPPSPSVAKEWPKQSPRPHANSPKVARAVVLPKITPASQLVPPPAASPVISPATLEVEVDHNFAEAHLSIWVDGSLTYTHLLEGAAKKHLVVFHHVQGHEIHAMQIQPGKHSLRVQVTSDGASYDQFATLASEFASGQESVLHVKCNKHGEINLSLQ